MTEIVVSKRDGIVREPDGTQHRVARGKTLADARHPVVTAYPNDWVPMAITFPVDDGDTVLSVSDAHDRLVQLENDLAEIEEVAEQRGAELVRLAEGLAGFGYDLPAEADRKPGWLVDLVLDALPVRAVAASLPLDAPAPHTAAEESVDVTAFGPPEPARVAPPRAVRKPRMAKP